MNTSPENLSGKVIDLAEEKAKRKFEAMLFNEAEKVTIEKLTSLSLKAKGTETVRDIDAKLQKMSPEESAEFIDMVRKRFAPSTFETLFHKMKLVSPIALHEIYKTMEADLYAGMLLLGMIGTREQQEQFASTLDASKAEELTVKALTYANKLVVKDPKTKALIGIFLTGEKLKGKSLEVFAEVRKRVEIQSQDAQIIDLARQIESDANEARLPFPPEDLDESRFVA